jgi:hypothetical protein
MEVTCTSDASSTQLCQNDVLSEVKLIIHHQCPGIELVSPVYASDGAKCHLTPYQRAYVGSTTQVGFNINLNQSESVGALMYRLQRKSADQSNEDIASSEEAICAQLVVIWNVNSLKDFYICLRVIEQDKDYVWDRDSLMKLAEQYSIFGIQHGPIEEAWLIYNDIRLMTSLNATHEEGCCKLKVTISNASIDDDTKRPWRVDLDR